MCDLCVCLVMFSTRLFGNLNLCIKLAGDFKSTTSLLSISMDSVKRKIEETVAEDLNASKKAKAENKEELDTSLNKIFENTNASRKPRKVVFLLSYLGKDFYGLQRNNDVNTVEEELLKALLKAKVILQDQFDHPKTMKFQRAARTDKGVSAVRNIVSLKIPLVEISGSLPEKINLLLPPQIRLIAVKRVTQSFDAKIACDARTYSYMLPTFAFAPTVEESTEEYRISEDRIQAVNEFLKNYLGTRNFYNFTSGRLPGDPSCKRYIISCECSPPFESNCLEFCVVKIKGQSFMLHQIRKMVGLTIAIMRNLTDVRILDKTWENERIDIPKAPGLGLMLEELHYDWYNKKFGSDGMHEPIEWKEYDDIVEKFKLENICLNIAKTEREEKSMLQWLETLPHHSYDVREEGPNLLLPLKISKTGDEDASKAESTVKPESEKVTETAVKTANGESSVISNAVESEPVSVELEKVESAVCGQTIEKEIKCES